MVNTSARQAGDPGFDSRVAQQIFYLFLGLLLSGIATAEGLSADSVQIEHSSSVQHKGNPNHSTSKMRFLKGSPCKYNSVLYRIDILK